MTMAGSKETRRNSDRTISIPQDTLTSWQGLLDMAAELLGVPIALVRHAVPSSRHTVCLLNSTARLAPENSLAAESAGAFWATPEACLRVPLSWPDGSLFGLLCTPNNENPILANRFYLHAQRIKRVMQDDLSMQDRIVASEHALAESTLAVARLREEGERERELAEYVSKSQQYFYQLFDLASDAIFIGYPDDGLAHVNQAACERLGYSRDELLRMSVLDFDGLHTPDEVAKRAKDTLEFGSTVFESIHVRRDGTRFPVEISSRTIELDGRQAIVCIARDISHRSMTVSGDVTTWHRLEGMVGKRTRELEQATVRLEQETEARIAAEAAKLDSDKLFLTLSRESPVGIVLIGLDGSITQSNPAFRSMVGYRGDELRSISFVDLVHEDDYAQHALLVRELLEGRRDSFRIEKRYIRKDGIVVWGSFRGALIRDPSGAPLLAVGLVEDIGARKRVEEELRFAEAKSRSILEAIPDLMFQVSADGHIVDFHASSLDDLAMPPERFLGFKCDDVLQPELARSVREIIDRVHRTNQVASIEYKMTTRNKKECDYEMRVAPISTGGFLAIVRDVTERKAAEVALRASEERFRVAQELSLDGFTVLRSIRDYDGTIVDFECEYGNPAAERIGVWEGCRGMRFHEAFIAVPNREELFQRFARIVVTGVPEDNESYIAGSEVAGWFRYMAVKLGDGLAVSFSDVTARVKTEQERARLAAAVEQAAEAIVITNRDGVIQYVNPAFSKVTGYSREEALNITPGVLRSGRHDESFYKTMWQTILSGEVWTGEVVNRRKDGKLYTEDMTITPVRDSSGEVTNFVAIKQDVTQRNQLEAEFRQAQKLEAVGRLAGGVAHDFNNLLTAILGSADMVLDQIEFDHPLREELDEIRSAGERAAALTRQLLAFSRRQVLDSKVLNLNSVVTNVEKMLRRLIGEDVELRCDLERDLKAAKADAGQLEQVLLNLVVNARDAMPHGGIISLATRNTTLDERTAAGYIDAVPGEYVALAVSDTGTGIAPELAGSVFEPFFTTKPEGKGTGLGLSTVYGIVHQSDGFVTLDTEPGVGSTFTVYLPVVTQDAVIPPGTASAPLSRGRGETILVVEDDTIVLKLVSRILERGGYNVLAASRGEFALDIVDREERSVDLILTDVIMPGMSGPAMISRVMCKHPALPVLFMSAYVDRSPEELQKAFPTAPFIAKPFTPEKLLREVGAILSETRR